MKKILGFGTLLTLVLGLNAVLFAQDGQNPPPMEGKRMGKRGGPEGRGGMPGGMRGKMRGGKRGGERGPRGGMHRGGFGISDHELAKLNLTDAQKVKVFDFKKKMADGMEAKMKDRKPGRGMQGMAPQDQASREEMRTLMTAKQLGTLTPEQKTKIDGMEAKRKEMMETRKKEMETMKAEMEKNHQEFLNIFTLDQRKQLETMRADRAKQMQERMPMRDGRGGGMRKGQKPAAPKPE